MRSRYRADIVQEIAHDRDAFTQSLTCLDSGLLLEGTGLYGRSERRLIDPSTGEVVVRRRLPKDLFGEGMAAMPHVGRQLTWREQQGILFDVASLDEIDRFSYEGEAWGLAFNGHQFFMTDGTNRLAVRDPDTFAALSTIVIPNVRSSVLLNDLTLHSGILWCNVLGAGVLLGLDAVDGSIVSEVDCSHLVPPWARGTEAVMNGVAASVDGSGLWVTGKLWASIFFITLVPIADQQRGHSADGRG